MRVRAWKYMGKNRDIIAAYLRVVEFHATLKLSADIQDTLYTFLTHISMLTSLSNRSGHGLTVLLLNPSPFVMVFLKQLFFRQLCTFFYINDLHKLLCNFLLQIFTFLSKSPPVLHCCLCISWSADLDIIFNWGEQNLVFLNSRKTRLLPIFLSSISEYDITLLGS